MALPIRTRPSFPYNQSLQSGEIAQSLSHVRLFVTTWTVAYHAPSSMGFSRQEYWSGLPFPSPGDLSKPRIEPRSPTLQADHLSHKCSSGRFHNPLRGQTEWKPQSQKTNQTDHMDLVWSQPCLTQWNYDPCHVGPLKMDRSWWRVLTKCGPLEKGMANHFSVLAFLISPFKKYWYSPVMVNFVSTWLGHSVQLFSQTLFWTFPRRCILDNINI